MATATPDDVEPIDSLVTAEWLHANLGAPDLVIIDSSVMIEVDGDGNMQTVNGRGHYEQNHIPGAVFADLMGEVVAADSPLQYDLLPPEEFAAVMGRLGVGDDTRVVIYDANQSVWAARVWWMLRWIGFDNAALLDGGFSAWTGAGYPVTAEIPTPVARSLSVNLRPELIADADEVLDAIDNNSVDLVDALPAAHYRGDFALYERPGHIPTASNLPTSSLVADSGHFLGNEELGALFSGERDKRTIHYCGGGIAASKTAFAMIRAGYTDVAVYTASLQEWAADPDKPLVTGTENPQ